MSSRSALPECCLREIGGKLHEPMEHLVVDVPEESVSSVMEEMGRRKGELIHMAPQGNRMRVEFSIPSRGLFGYRSDFMTATRGEGIMTSVFDGYQPHKGIFPAV